MPDSDQPDPRPHGPGAPGPGLGGPGSHGFGPADSGLAVTVGAAPGGPSLVTVAGDLDHHTAPRLQAALAEVVLAPGAGLVLDLSGLTYCDSIGITVLVGAHQRARAAGAALALAGLDPDISRVFHVVGLDQILSFHGSVEEAVRAVGPDAH
ncbi:STAS domain-containing protein [Streptacidiphilus sp. ASG 303]|uniref:STAS domain-containing protein n=1 Tax=Streptacidiphilus sp. ASG 303 TaxID=2896847 RepID=UPI001E4EA74D|nr:STAS domain-containing protein [Streptacidiphilus sp. ASG 303]MCD0483688.1 STAS domain-containing protein [Streptacidiphilus sp. ASG 303]